MFWLKNKKTIFQYALLFGGLSVVELRDGVSLVRVALEALGGGGGGGGGGVFLSKTPYPLLVLKSS